MMNERKRLLDEIAVNISSIHKYNKLMYTLTGAILTYGLSKDEPIALIIPYVFITAIYYVVQGFERNICKISAYIITFLENEASGTSFNSETRFYEYDILQWKHPNHNVTEEPKGILNCIKKKIIKKKFIKEKNLMIYLSSLSICGFFAAYKYIQLSLHNSIGRIELSIHLGIIIVAYIVCAIICINARVIRSERKKKEIEKWQLVLQYEQKLPKIDMDGKHN